MSGWYAESVRGGTGSVPDNGPDDGRPGMVHATGPEYHSVPTWRVALYRATLRRGHHRGTARRRAVRARRVRRVAGRPPRGPQGRLHRRTGRRRHERLSRAGPRRRPRSPGSTPRTSSSSTRPTRPGPPSRTPSRAPRSSSTWATATAGRAATAIRCIRPRRTASASTRPPAAATTTHQYFGEASIASRGQAGQERGRPAQPPVLRERQLGARAAGGHARRRQAAGRQLRGRASSRPVRRRSIAEAWSSPSYFVRAILGGGRSIQTAWLRSPERQRAPDRLREPAQPGLRRPDGSGERDLRASRDRSS